MRQALTVLTTTLLCLQALAAESVRADPPGRDSVLADQLTVSPGERSSLTWQAEKRREGHEPYVFFKIAAQSDRAGGYCNRGVQLLINGKPIDVPLDGSPEPEASAAGESGTGTNGTSEPPGPTSTLLLVGRRWFPWWWWQWWTWCCEWWSYQWGIVVTQ